MCKNMRWRHRWAEIAYQVLKDDVASSTLLTEDDRKRIARKVGTEMGKEMGYIGDDYPDSLM